MGQKNTVSYLMWSLQHFPLDYMGINASWRSSWSSASWSSSVCRQWPRFFFPSHQLHQAQKWHRFLAVYWLLIAMKILKRITCTKNNHRKLCWKPKHTFGMSCRCFFLRTELESYLLRCQPQCQCQCSSSKTVHRFGPFQISITKMDAVGIFP